MPEELAPWLEPVIKPPLNLVSTKKQRPVVGLMQPTHTYWDVMRECMKDDAPGFSYMRAVAYWMHENRGSVLSCYRWAQLIAHSDPDIREWVELKVVDQIKEKTRAWCQGENERPHTNLQQMISRWLHGDSSHADPEGRKNGQNCWYRITKPVKQQRASGKMDFETSKVLRYAWDEACDLNKPWQPPWVYRRMAERGRDPNQISLLQPFEPDR